MKSNLTNQQLRVKAANLLNNYATTKQTIEREDSAAHWLLNVCSNDGLFDIVPDEHAATLTELLKAMAKPKVQKELLNEINEPMLSGTVDLVGKLLTFFTAMNGEYHLSLMQAAYISEYDCEYTDKDLERIIESTQRKLAALNLAAVA